MHLAEWWTVIYLSQVEIRFFQRNRCFKNFQWNSKYRGNMRQTHMYAVFNDNGPCVGRGGHYLVKPPTDLDPNTTATMRASHEGLTFLSSDIWLTRLQSLFYCNLAVSHRFPDLPSYQVRRRHSVVIRESAKY